MKVVLSMPYKKHILVCVNEREEGKDCCSRVGGQDVFVELKSWVRDEGLTQQVWVTRTRCLGFCNAVGTTVVVYPERMWFLEVEKKDLERLKEKICEGL